MITRIFQLRTCIVMLMFLSFQQTFSQTASKRLLGSFIFSNQAYNYEFTMEAGDSYSFSISSITDSGQTDNTVNADNAHNAGKRVFNEFGENIFETVFVGIMKEKYGMENDGIKKTATEVFFKIKAKLDFIDDEPTTAYFILRK